MQNTEDFISSFWFHGRHGHHQSSQQLNEYFSPNKHGVCLEHLSQIDFLQEPDLLAVVQRLYYVEHNTVLLLQRILHCSLRQFYMPPASMKPIFVQTHVWSVDSLQMKKVNQLANGDLCRTEERKVSNL